MSSSNLKIDWPFDFPRDLGVVVSKRVLDGSKPIKIILRSEDGNWMVCCETANGSEDYSLVSFGCLYDRFLFCLCLQI